MIVKIAGWAAVVLSVLILLVFTGIRLVSMTGSPAPAARLDARYVEHPWVALLHIVPGFCRSRWHRCSLSHASASATSPSTGAWAGRSPAAPPSAACSRWSPACASPHSAAWRREVQRHREWMIRVYALAMGVASIRIFIALLTGLAALPFEKAFGPSFWLGFGVNLLVAEARINYTGQPRNAAARPSISQVR